MKVVIIEDEQLAAGYLQKILKKLDPNIEILAILSSVMEAIDFFSTRNHPDLIFSDIQLGDGLSFEIFQQMTVEVPIVFCTAYDYYAIEAFKINGIEYVLKPYDEASIGKALGKFTALKDLLTKKLQRQFDAIKHTLDAYRANESGTFMIHYRDRHMPINLNKIGLFYLENDLNSLYLLSGKTYFLPESLEEVEKKLDQSFFRVNRQCIINRKAISEAQEYFPRKLKIILNFPFEREIIVSREKKTRLLKWLSSE